MIFSNAAAESGPATCGVTEVSSVSFEREDWAGDTGDEGTLDGLLNVRPKNALERRLVGVCVGSTVGDDRDISQRGRGGLEELFVLEEDEIDGEASNTSPRPRLVAPILSSLSSSNRSPT